MTVNKKYELLSDSLFLIIVGMVYYFVTRFVPPYNVLYNVNANFPWGIFTSIFVPDTWQNFGLYAFCIVLFMISAYRLPRVVVRKRAIFLTIFMFVIAILSDYYWVMTFPSEESFGQSGVIFALYGLVTALCGSNIMYFRSNLRYKTELDESKKKTEEKISLYSVVIAVVLLLYPVFQPKVFFMEGYHVAYQIHEFSFVVGVVFGIVCVALLRK